MTTIQTEFLSNLVHKLIKVAGLQLVRPTDRKFPWEEDGPAVTPLKAIGGRGFHRIGFRGKKSFGFILAALLIPKLLVSAEITDKKTNKQVTSQNSGVQKKPVLIVWEYRNFIGSMFSTTLEHPEDNAILFLSRLQWWQASAAKVSRHGFEHEGRTWFQVIVFYPKIAGTPSPPY
jgi:hypothetical protein